MKRINSFFQISAIFIVLITAGCSEPDSNSSVDPQLANSSLPSGYSQVAVTSSLDGMGQDVAIIEPQQEMTQPVPLVVYLHGSSVNFDDILRRPEIIAEADHRGWLLAAPDFRGELINHCGDEYAQQDILDTVNWAKENYPVDENRIYLIGFSGGGFMSMVMAHRYPDIWAAVSTWSGFPDLLANYEYRGHTRYGDILRTCFDGDPNVSPEVAERFRQRSPITYFTPEAELPPLDLNGQKDDTNVPVDSSMLAYRALVPGSISDEEMASIFRGQPVPEGMYLHVDPSTGRDIYLRREADNLRVTIRSGGHEILAAPAFEWFDQFTRK